MSQDAFFKIRPTKRSNPEARTTLDRLHQVRLQSISEKGDNNAALKQQIQQLQADSSSVKDEVRYEQMQNEKKKLEREVSRSEHKNDLLEYFLDAGDIMYS